jgi:hypothetical protein
MVMGLQRGGVDCWYLFSDYKAEKKSARDGWQRWLQQELRQRALVWVLASVAPLRYRGRSAQAEETASLPHTREV